MLYKFELSVGLSANIWIVWRTIIENTVLSTAQTHFYWIYLDTENDWLSKHTYCLNLMVFIAIFKTKVCLLIRMHCCTFEHHLNGSIVEMFWYKKNPLKIQLNAIKLKLSLLFLRIFTISHIFVRFRHDLSQFIAIAFWMVRDELHWIQSSSSFFVMDNFWHSSIFLDVQHLTQHTV